MRYAVTRFGIFLLTIVVAITINFIVIHATPADPIAAMLGRMVTRGSSVAGGAQIVKVYTEAFALDQPLYVQYLLYVKNLLMGDLGYSLAYFPQKVSAVVLRAVPWSPGSCFSRCCLPSRSAICSARSPYGAARTGC